MEARCETSTQRLVAISAVTLRGSDGQFAGPGGVGVAPDGSVYVAGFGNNHIQKFLVVP